VVPDIEYEKPLNNFAVGHAAEHGDVKRINAATSHGFVLFCWC